jgi:aryl-alcohol dehydrogenase-like predicted oxidoreductase
MGGMTPAKPPRRGVVDAGRRSLLKALAAATLLPAAAGAAPAPLLGRRIPASGETLPAIGLGTWRTFDVAEAADLVDAQETLKLFAAQGGTLVDSSPMYGRSEAVVGQLAGNLGLAGKLFLATKVWTTGREAGIRQMEESMRRMGTSRMDLMQIHNLADAATHAKTLRAWKDAGRIRYWGISHYHAGAYAEVDRFLQAEKPDFLQINYSLAEPESGRHLLPLARDAGIAVIANRPFAEGALFERVRGRELPPWAAEFEAASWAQFFLKWILADPAVTCSVPATRNPRYVLDNMAAGRGRLPDAATRQKMLALLRT